MYSVKYFWTFKSYSSTLWLFMLFSWITETGWYFYWYAHFSSIHEYKTTMLYSTLCVLQETMVFRLIVSNSRNKTMKNGFCIYIYIIHLNTKIVGICQKKTILINIKDWPIISLNNILFLSYTFLPNWLFNILNITFLE